MKVISVKFKESGRAYYFDPKELEIKEGEFVIVETARGVECGEVVRSAHEIASGSFPREIKPVIRLADGVDVRRMRQNRADEKATFELCEKRIAAHKLQMKLVDAEYTLDRSKLVFYFTADNRVDFRELVKDLAGQFHTRIELRQIGVRDESKMLGGLGVCGQPFCCIRTVGLGGGGPAVLLQPVFEKLPAGFHQDGKGTGVESEPGQDQRCMRPFDVLPGLRAEEL